MAAQAVRTRTWIERGRLGWPRDRWNVALGAAVWIAWMAMRRPMLESADWVVALFLLSPLVLVPLCLRLIASTDGAEPREWIWIAAKRMQLPSAALLVASCVLPQSMPAAALALPWFATTLLVAATGAWRIARRGARPIAALCFDMGYVYLAVGGFWAVAWRAAITPPHYQPLIVFLTVPHFHYAGIVLPIVTALAARAMPGRIAQAAALGVILGIPAIAIGISIAQWGGATSIECAAVLLTVVASLLCAWLHVRLAAQAKWPPASRALWLIAAASLAAGMSLAALYGAREYYAVSWLSIPWMWSVHGTINALGFALPCVVGWSIAARSATGTDGRLST